MPDRSESWRAKRYRLIADVYASHDRAKAPRDAERVLTAIALQVEQGLSRNIAQQLPLLRGIAYRRPRERMTPGRPYGCYAPWWLRSTTNGWFGGESCSP